MRGLLLGGAGKREVPGGDDHDVALPMILLYHPVHPCKLSQLRRVSQDRREANHKQVTKPSRHMNEILGVPHRNQPRTKHTVKKRMLIG